MSQFDKANPEEQAILDFIRAREQQRDSGQAVSPTTDGIGELDEVWNSFELLSANDFPELAVEAEPSPLPKDCSEKVSVFNRLINKVNEALFTPSFAVACSFALIGFCAYYFVVVYHGLPQTYQSVIGGTELITYEDGSTVLLDSGSEVAVTDSMLYRKAEGLDGTALFTITPNPEKPYTVKIGNTTITVLGTAFSVYQEEDYLEIVVQEGRVRVQNQLMDPDLDVELSKDQKIEIFGDKSYRLSQINADRALAWQEGLVYFNNTPLEQVVARLNHYYKKPITIGNEQLRELKLSGYFSTKDKLLFLEALREITPIQMRDEHEKTILY